MFQVEPNLWLQAFAHPWLTALMKLITFFGYDWLYAAAVIGLGFGLRLRPMLGVMLALVLAGSVTHATKDGLQLPRPVEVDARVLDKGQPNTRWLTRHGGASGFLALPDPAAVDAARTDGDMDPGFLSGHVAAAAALCVGLLLFFPGRPAWLRTALLLWPVLMALSRMYLGRHFLGDVLAGALNGALAAWLAHALWTPTRQGWLLGLAALVCAASPWLAFLERGVTGQLLGLALAYRVFAVSDWPQDGGTPWVRLGRVALAFILYWLVKTGLDGLANLAGWAESSLMSIPLAALGVVAVLPGGARLCRVLRLYPGRVVRDAPPGAQVTPAGNARR